MKFFYESKPFFCLLRLFYVYLKNVNCFCATSYFSDFHHISAHMINYVFIMLLLWYILYVDVCCYVTHIGELLYYVSMSYSFCNVFGNCFFGGNKLFFIFIKPNLSCLRLCQDVVVV